MTASPLVLMLAGVVSMDPSASALPGRSTIQQLTNGLGWWALVASLVGLVLGAAAWALGSHTNNYQYADDRPEGGARLRSRRPGHRGRADPCQFLVRGRPWDSLTRSTVSRATRTRARRHPRPEGGRRRRHRRHPPDDRGHSRRFVQHDHQRLRRSRRHGSGARHHEGNPCRVLPPAAGLGRDRCRLAGRRARQRRSRRAPSPCSQEGRSGTNSPSWPSSAPQSHCRFWRPGPSRPSPARSREPCCAARSMRLPLALLFTGVSVQLVALGLAATDQASAMMLDAAGDPTHRLLLGLVAGLSRGGGLGLAAFGGFMVVLAAAIVSFVLWLELAVRSAAIAAASLFLPLALAGLAWPATAHWARRLGETLAALVLSKLVIAAVLALAAGLLGSSSGLAGVVEGIALLAVAGLRPVRPVEAGTGDRGGSDRPLRGSRPAVRPRRRAPRFGRQRTGRSPAWRLGSLASAALRWFERRRQPRRGAAVRQPWRHRQPAPSPVAAAAPAPRSSPSAAGSPAGRPRPWWPRSVHRPSGASPARGSGRHLQVPRVRSRAPPTATAPITCRRPLGVGARPEDAATDD